MAYSWEGLEEVDINKIKFGDILVCGHEFDSNIVVVDKVKFYNDSYSSQYQVWGTWYTHPDDIGVRVGITNSHMPSSNKFYYLRKRKRTSGFGKWVKDHD